MYKIDEKTIRELLDEGSKVVAENINIIILENDNKKYYFLKK